MYTMALAYITSLKYSSPAMASQQLQNGLHECEAKLLKYFDKSTYDFEYYYHATSTC